jgi:hypothetical protein
MEERLAAHRGAMILVLGILSWLACPLVLGIIAWVLGNGDCARWTREGWTRAAAG